MCAYSIAYYITKRPKLKSIKILERVLLYLIFGIGVWLLVFSIVLSIRIGALGGSFFYKYLCIKDILKAMLTLEFNKYIKITPFLKIYKKNTSLEFNPNSTDMEKLEQLIVNPVMVRHVSVKRRNSFMVHHALDHQKSDDIFQQVDYFTGKSLKDSITVPFQTRAYKYTKTNLVLNRFFEQKNITTSTNYQLYQNIGIRGNKDLGIAKTAVLVHKFKERDPNEVKLFFESGTKTDIVSFNNYNSPTKGSMGSKIFCSKSTINLNKAILELKDKNESISRLCPKTISRASLIENRFDSLNNKNQE